VQAVLGLVRRAADDERRYVYTMLLLRHADTDLVQDSLVAGADDFLAKPIIHGELLTRLRVAARRLELQRRLLRIGQLDPLTGLLSQSGWLRRTQRLWAGGPSRGAVCLLVDVDLLGLIGVRHGRVVGDAVIRAAAARLKELVPPGDLLAHSGGGRFSVLLRSASDSEADAKAEEIREALAKTPVTCGPTEISCTASVGWAAAGDAADTPEALLHRASEALHAAKLSGRNCVIRFAQLAEDAQAWAELATPGKLFERTFARDVMTPCTAVLRTGQSLREALRLIRLTPWKALPVVDGQGKLIGLLDEKAIGLAEAEQAASTVGEVMEPEPPYFQEDDRFASLLDFFRHQPSRLTVIVRDGWPTGLVTASALGVLGKPVTTETFSPQNVVHASAEYLRIPDVAAAGGTPSVPATG
jgi:diguanylate cyclase (GGDEF)-like protein